MFINSLRTGMLVVSCIGALMLQNGCKMRRSSVATLKDEQSQAKELQDIRQLLGATHADRAFALPANLPKSLPPSEAGLAAPLGQMPGLVIGVVPNGGSSSYNKPAVDALKRQMKAVFLDQLSKKEGLFFTVAAVNLERFTRFFKGTARRTLQSQAKTELDNGYRANLSEYQKAGFSPEALAGVVLIVDDDVAYHESQMRPYVANDYSTAFHLPVAPEASAVDPVPVTLVTRSGEVAIGPFWVGYKDDDMLAIRQIMERLLVTK